MQLQNILTEVQRVQKREEVRTAELLRIADDVRTLARNLELTCENEFYGDLRDDETVAEFEKLMANPMMNFIFTAISNSLWDIQSDIEKYSK